MALSVFEIGQLVEENRPMILGKKLSNLDEQSLMNYGIIRGEPGCPIEAWTQWDDIFIAEWPARDFLRPRVGGIPVREWDYFQFPSTSGLLSQRAIDVLMPHLDYCFVPLPSSLEGERYYFLHTKKTIDALNVEESDIVYSDTTIIWIKRYEFYMDRLSDPVIFSIPQFRPFLFATESIPEIVENAGLNGFEFRPPPFYPIK